MNTSLVNRIIKVDQADVSVVMLLTSSYGCLMPLLTIFQLNCGRQLYVKGNERKSQTCSNSLMNSIRSN